MTSQRSRLLKEGVVAGLLGYIAVVALFAFLNALQGLPLFYTPTVLGTALLGGALDPTGPYAPVLAYNGLHLVATLALGVAASFLAARAEADHDLGAGLVFFVLALGGWVPIFFGAIAVEYLEALSWLDVVVGSAVGAAATLGYVAWAHRGLVADLLAEART